MYFYSLIYVKYRKTNLSFFFHDKIFFDRIFFAWLVITSAGKFLASVNILKKIFPNRNKKKVDGDELPGQVQAYFALI